MAVQNETKRDGMLIFQRSTKYLSTHYHELCEKYPKHYIAIYDGEVVGVSLGFHDLFDDLKVKSIPLRDTVVHFMETEDVKWIFPS